MANPLDYKLNAQLNGENWSMPGIITRNPTFANVRLRSSRSRRACRLDKWHWAVY